MFDASELRAIADFVEATQSIFQKMVSTKPLEILFDDDVSGGYTIARKDGTPLGKVQITDAGDYEFVPGSEETLEGKTD
jgi:hypothetical protein